MNRDDTVKKFAQRKKWIIPLEILPRWLYSSTISRFEEFLPGPHFGKFTREGRECILI